MPPRALWRKSVSAGRTASGSSRCLSPGGGQPDFQGSGKRVRSLDIFVSNARTEAPTFYQPPMEITLDKWDTAVDSQGKAFLVGAREAARLINERKSSGPGGARQAAPTPKQALFVAEYLVDLNAT